MTFAHTLITWQLQHGRHDLPWQNTLDPYVIWLSEIMLQQTQVKTVMPYFQAFIARFPDVGSLAAAPLEQVLALWSGLGYYSRARNLHQAAQLIQVQHGGRFPQTVAELSALPGVGRSTAAAIAVFAFGANAAILDGNVQRVLARCFQIPGHPTSSSTRQQLWQLAESLLPEQQCVAYTQGLMDLGSGVCTRSKPHCKACPMEQLCQAAASGRQAEFPGKKVRPALPQRHTQMLLIRNDHGVLLQQRPPTGIWGGLMSLPQLEPGVDAVLWCRQQLGLNVQQLPALPLMRHRFSHFELLIQPQVLWLNAAPTVLAENSWVWCDWERALGSGIPTPVRRLLINIAAAN